MNGPSSGAARRSATKSAGGGLTAPYLETNRRTNGQPRAAPAQAQEWRLRAPPMAGESSAKPSGTTNWITPVMTRRSSALKAGREADHEQDRQGNLGDAVEEGDQSRRREWTRNAHASSHSAGWLHLGGNTAAAGPRRRASQLLTGDIGLQPVDRLLRRSSSAARSTARAGRPRAPPSFCRATRGCSPSPSARRGGAARVSGFRRCRPSSRRSRRRDSGAWRARSTLPPGLG